jgi:hypothetical protein
MGRPFSLVDNEQGRAVCLVDEKTRAELDMPRDPTGTHVMLGGRRYTIVGVVKSRPDSGMFGRRGNGSELYIPFATAAAAPRAPADRRGGGVPLARR